MIISHKYQFIFIKTVKTAGTSTEVFLSQHCGEKDVVTPIWPYVSPHRAMNHLGIWNPIPELIHNSGQGIKRTVRNLRDKKKFYNHIPAWLVRQRVSPKIWNSYFKFCVERNPWDKTLSHYHMVNNWAGGNLSFSDYMEQAKFCINSPIYTDAQNEVLVDQVVKYESLTEELGAIFQKLGIPFDGSLGVNAKSDYRKDRRPYQEVYSRKHQTLIQEAFAQEIEMHNYSF